MTTTINASTTAGLVQTADTSGVLALQSNGTTALSTSGANVTIAGTLTTSSRGIAQASVPAGSVLQVVNATHSTSATNSTTTYADTGLTATITPTSATSKILILVNQSGVNNDTINSGTSVQLLRTSTSLVVFASYFGFGGNGVVMGASACYLDSPATTSATTYKTQFKRGGGSNNAFVQDNSSTSTITLLEIAA